MNHKFSFRAAIATVVVVVGYLGVVLLVFLVARRILFPDKVIMLSEVVIIALGAMLGYASKLTYDWFREEEEKDES